MANFTTVQNERHAKKFILLEKTHHQQKANQHAKKMYVYAVALCGLTADAAAATTAAVIVALI